ncbi:TPA: CoA ester lyase [Serratia fonticola]
MPLSAAKTPPNSRRSWLFLAGADREALIQGAKSGADVLIQELETFTPPELRARARALTREILPMWRTAGSLTSVRINPLDGGGLEDLDAVMSAHPDIIMMSFVSTPQQVAELDKAVHRFEIRYDIEPGSTELVPNIESALGIINICAIAQASPRIRAILVGTEDMVADLGAERTRAGSELNYIRQRFLVECTAMGITPIDCPYSYSDNEGAQRDMHQSRSMGYRAKAIVNEQFVGLVNQTLTPSAQEITRARQIISTFEDARKAAKGKRVAAAVVNGFLSEVPDYLAAQRLLKLIDQSHGESKK